MMMHIVTPSHSKEAGVEEFGSMDVTKGAEPPPTTHNRYLDALLLEGRALTIAEWQELSSAPLKNAALPLKYSTISTMSNGDQIMDRPLFRYVGMVQDMLETEYFSINDESSSMPNSMHPFASDATLKLAERTPMMLVSIPHTSDFSQVGSNPSFSGSMESRSEHHLAKRVRYDDPDVPLSVEKTIVPSVVPEVVAHFYLDQYPRPDASEANDAASRPSSFKLNQMVEILGILEEVPAPTEPNDDDDMGIENGMDVQASSMMLLEEQETTVIPSHIPRLHVLWYRIVTLDDEDDEIEALATRILPSTAKESLYHVWTKVGLTDSGLNDQGLTLGGWNAVSQALWLLLHSQAERDPATGVVRSAPHDSSTLGCISLNFLFPNAEDALESDTNCDIAEFITYTMQRLVPHFQILTLSNNHGAATTSTPLTAIQAPHKMCGRLRSTALQQPAGTLLIVDVRKWNVEPGNAIHHGDDVHHPFHSLRQICRHHRLQYMFDGGMRIPFEADYRVLVLSNAMTQHLVPCTLTMQLPSPDLGNIERDWNTLLGPLLSPLRDEVQRQRSQRSKGIVRLDESVIERSQHEFCERRRRSRDNKSTAISTGVKEHVDEADFHRWLTLCRIRARSRSSSVAELEDWESALKLDDCMVDSLINNKV